MRRTKLMEIKHSNFIRRKFTPSVSDISLNMNINTLIILYVIVLQFSLYVICTDSTRVHLLHDSRDYSLSNAVFYAI